MGLFDNLTVGYEWETALLDDGFHMKDSKLLNKIIAELRREFPYSRTGTDGMWRMGDIIFEIRSGILKSFKEHEKKARMMTERIHQLAKKHKVIFYPSSSLEIYGRAFGLHVHVGTITDPGLANLVANKFSKYAPALIALSANSPVWKFKAGEFKSYRMSSNADWCSMPRRIVNPDFLYFLWGDDINVKFHYKPTVELRCGDSASSEIFLIEYAALSALSLVIISETEKDFKVSRNEYIENMVNRIQAFKYGLQAEFIIKGKTTTPGDLILDLLKRGRAVLKRFGCNKNDFSLILEMIKKRQTQSDFKKRIYDLIPDHYSYMAEMIRIMKDRKFFEKYLETAPVLPVIPQMKMEDFIMSQIDYRAELHYITENVTLPFNYVLNILEKLIKEKKLKKRMLPEYGYEYIRI